MIKNFVDKDGQVFDLVLRGRFATSIRSGKALCKILDDSSAAKPPAVAESYRKHTYMYAMRDFGMLNWSHRHPTK